MSEKLLNFAKTFLESEEDSNVFVEKFIHQWKLERDTEISCSDSPEISEVLSSIFCLADMYNPDKDRESYELDEAKLRFEISKVLSGKS